MGHREPVAVPRSRGRVVASPPAAPTITDHYIFRVTRRPPSVPRKMAVEPSDGKRLLRQLSSGGRSERKNFFDGSSDNLILYIYFLARSALKNSGVHRRLTPAQRAAIKKHVRIFRAISPDTPKKKTGNARKRFAGRIKKKILKHVQSGGWLTALIPLVGLVASAISNAVR